MKGFEQKKGIDFEEIFSSGVKMTSIPVLLSLAASMNLEVEQLDMKTTFLHGDLEEEIYMEQPEGLAVIGKENLVCRLRKSLYGLKQAPRQWYKRFDSFIGEHGYNHIASDHCVCVKRLSCDDFIILLLYVDDMLIIGKDTNRICKLKSELSKSFTMKDLGSAKQILGMKISRDLSKSTRKLWLSQESYVEKTSHIRLVWLVISLRIQAKNTGRLSNGYFAIFEALQGGVCALEMSKVQKCVALSTTEPSTSQQLKAAKSCYG
ncbi:Retrovirus-related Pol polyprotein from transposon TNT 1-94-like protein [Drosera capensis]